MANLPAIFNNSIELSLCGLNGVAIMRNMTIGAMVRVFNGHTTWVPCDWEASYLPPLYIGVLSESILDQPFMPTAFHRLLTRMKVKNKFRVSIHVTANQPDECLAPEEWLMLGALLGVKLPRPFVDASGVLLSEGKIDTRALEYHKCTTSAFAMLNDVIINRHLTNKMEHEHCDLNDTIDNTSED